MSGRFDIQVAGLQSIALFLQERTAPLETEGAWSRSRDGRLGGEGA